jgi:SAM-dependent methyltransferase
MNNSWLGENLKDWSQNIRNGFVRAYILFAFHETGVFELLRKEAPLTSKEIANKLELHPEILDGLLNFLYHADKVLVKENNKFSLSKDGKEWLFTDTVMTMSFGLVGAASCLYSELIPCLKGEKKYGVDFVRKGDLVAKGSYYTSAKNYPWIIEEMNKLGVKKVADLGCGSAKILIDFCKLDKNIRGVGVDISSGAIKEATENIKREKLTERIKLIEADLTKPQTYKKSLSDVDAFNAIMVVHHLLEEDEEPLIKFLLGLKESFPGKYLFIGELNPMSDEEYQKLPYQDRIHMLCSQYIAHQVMSGKDLLLRKEKWIDLFKKTGIEVVKIKDDFSFPLVEYVLRL